MENKFSFYKTDKNIAILKLYIKILTGKDGKLALILVFINIFLHDYNFAMLLKSYLIESHTPNVTFSFCLPRSIFVIASHYPPNI